MNKPKTPAGYEAIAELLRNPHLNKKQENILDDEILIHYARFTDGHRNGESLTMHKSGKITCSNAKDVYDIEVVKEVFEEFRVAGVYDLKQYYAPKDNTEINLIVLDTAKKYYICNINPQWANTKIKSKIKKLDAIMNDRKNNNYSQY